MRLIDRRTEVVLDGLRTGSGRDVEHVARNFDAAAASIRYVLDVEASDACAELVRTGDGLFSVENPLFRMPADCFWVELLEEPSSPGGSRLRMGYLVQSAASGRNGAIIPFSETNEGYCRRLPCEILFDLDSRMTRGNGLYAFSHPHMAHLAELLEHCMLSPEAEGMAALRPGNSGRSLLAELAEGTWYALPLLFAFVALLNSPQVVETRQSDLSRLNRARARRGRVPLLDHVEVRLALGERTGASTALGVHRNAPRLHVVRGHVVHRHGKTFWRQAHLRGDSQKAIVSKTVRVTAGRSVRNDAARHVRRTVSNI